MKYYRFAVELLAPLMVQQDRQSNAPRGLPYLPGSTLRGALAARHLRKGGHPGDNDFKLLFLSGNMCFPDLFPTDDPLVVSHALPLTAFSCKRFPGFRSQGGHGVQDTLHHTAIARIWEKPVTPESRTCSVCGNDAKAITGFWSGDLRTSRGCEPTIAFDRHTGIDRVTGTVAPSIFYTTQAISNYWKNSLTGDYEAQHLTGGMYAEENQIQALEPLISGTFFAGADRSRGMGEMKLTIDVLESPSFDITNWNKAFKEKVRKVTGNSLPDGIYFTLSLESNAILIDRFLRPDVAFDLHFPDIRPVLRVTKSQTVRGWNAGYALAKPDDQALVMGSVFLFCYGGANVAGLEKYLNSLTCEGVGLRRAEGFGRISICNPFHTLEVI